MISSAVICIGVVYSAYYISVLHELYVLVEFGNDTRLNASKINRIVCTLKII